jgi:hypothetical protein
MPLFASFFLPTSAELIDDLRASGSIFEPIKAFILGLVPRTSILPTGQLPPRGSAISRILA